MLIFPFNTTLRQKPSTKSNDKNLMRKLIRSVSIQAVPLSIDKHRQLMVSVLADQRITELQQRGGAWLAGLTNRSSGLAQKSPDCRYHNPKFYTLSCFIHACCLHPSL